MNLHLHSFQVLLYIKVFTAVYLSPVINAATLAEASFNDTRCGDGGVCPTDPLLFTCNITNSPATRVLLTFSFAEMELISLTNNNVIQGSAPDGINIQSHSVTGPSPYDYILTLSVANASRLNGGMITCDSNIGVTDSAGCPVAGDPGPPLDLTHDMSANTVSSAVITWDPPSTTGGGDGISITGYRIMSSDNGLNLKNETDDTTYTITGLQYNTNYNVKVTATNSCGQESGPASVVVNIEAGVPPPPSLLSPELYCDVPLEDGRPVIIKWMPGDKIDGVVYPGVVNAHVHLDPGDGTTTCSGMSADSANCSATIPSEGVYNVSLTLTNDVGPSQPVLDVFDLTKLKVMEETATSVRVTLNYLCRDNTDYTVQVFFGVREQGSDDECVTQQPVTADIVPGESVILTVDTTTLMLDPGQEYCSTNAPFTEPPVDDGSDSTSDGVSTGAIAGLAVALILLVALPVGVVLGWCIWRRGKGLSGQGTQQKVLYEVPGPVNTAIPLTDNQAYGQVPVPGPVDTAIPLTDNQAYGQVKN